jgi:sugar (pentulose or hexulose) kinase
MLWCVVVGSCSIFIVMLCAAAVGENNAVAAAAAAAAAAGVSGEMFATIERALDERTIGHNPERLNLMKVRRTVQQLEVQPLTVQPLAVQMPAMQPLAV